MTVHSGRIILREFAKRLDSAGMVHDENLTKYILDMSEFHNYERSFAQDSLLRGASRGHLRGKYHAQAGDIVDVRVTPSIITWESAKPYHLPFYAFDTVRINSRPPRSLIKVISDTFSPRVVA